jgi:hypothetical protein
VKPINAHMLAQKVIMTKCLKTVTHMAERQLKETEYHTDIALMLNAVVPNESLIIGIENKNSSGECSCLS